ncbi:SLC13 family permease [Patulibacter defluvii]|uniref:SLC13 family permease n=1 Tax=Patulibacter defluvii TaxID=3095358 RepID=UPI002A748D28|nr:SLC13 family permease [Patulibacter sp. DM4]
MRSSHVLAPVVASSHLLPAIGAAWPPFALVAGLLLLGVVAEHRGLFRRLGAGLERLPGPPWLLVVAALGLVVAVTAVLNLDTAVVFVTPVAVHAARRRGIDPRPVAYGALTMANAGSLLLPGANLTNLLVGDLPAGGARWLVEVAPAGLAAAAAALAVVLLRDRRAWRAPAAATVPPARVPAARGDRALMAAIGLAGAAMVVLSRPALPVLAIGLAVAAVAVGRAGLERRTVMRAVGPVVLIGLLVVVAALGWLARAWTGPAGLVADSGPLATAAIGALAAVLLNNLPAAALLGAGHPAHPEALLVGLNLGPNLFVSGSLAAYLWWRACAGAGVDVGLRGLLSRAPLAVLPAVLAALLLLPR